MAYRDGKADPALLKALDDESPLRRATAVDVLCQNGLAEPRDVLRKLLADPKPTVQLRAALALAQARDAAAVDTLIDLLGKLPVGQGHFAEEYLSNLAGDQSPKDDADRRRLAGQSPRRLGRLVEVTEGTASLEEFTQAHPDRAGPRKGGKTDPPTRRRLLRGAAEGEDGAQGHGRAGHPHVAGGGERPGQEVSQNAREVLQEIDKDKPAPLSPVAARVVALCKPAGAAEVLLAYLPFCDDEGMEGEVPVGAERRRLSRRQAGAGPGQGPGRQGRPRAAAPPPRPSASARWATTCRPSRSC